MTHQRIVEIWKQIENINCSVVPLLVELHNIYGRKYEKEIVDILLKYDSVQEDLTLIDMQETFEEQGIEPWKGGDAETVENGSEKAENGP